nr:hypothetical protein [Tanacetum cinerariifolium]
LFDGKNQRTKKRRISPNKMQSAQAPYCALRRSRRAYTAELKDNNRCIGFMWKSNWKHAFRCVTSSFSLKNRYNLSHLCCYSSKDLSKSILKVPVRSGASVFRVWKLKKQAGPDTIAEALNTGLHIILNDYIPAQSESGTGSRKLYWEMIEVNGDDGGCYGGGVVAAMVVK